jgi:hypothetical protein
MQTQEGRVRASDAEREQVIEALRAAVGEGRLTLEEGDSRMASAYAARYRDELRPLTTDLPGNGWEALTRTPEAFSAMRRRLRVHGAGTVAVAAALIGGWVLSGAHFFWPLIPLIILTFSFLRHARFVRFVRMARMGAPWFWSQAGRGPWGRGSWGQGWGER